MKEKSSPQPIALAYADHHLHDWTSYSENHSRLDWGCSVFRELSDASKKYGKIPVLFAGDLYHNPRYLENLTIYKSLLHYSMAFEQEHIPFIAIPGNHDVCEKNTDTLRSISYLDTYDLLFKSFTNLHDGKVFIMGELAVAGIPYMNKNKGFAARVKKARRALKVLEEARPNKDIFKVLLIHTDLHGAITPAEFKVEEAEEIPENMDDFFRGFDLVLSGHIHKSQRLGKKIYMLGAPEQQGWSDQGTEMGYWEIYKNAKPKFIPMRHPEFAKLKPGDPKPEGIGFYEYEADETKAESSEVTEVFHKNTSRGKLAKRYLKHKGITSKKKLKVLTKLLKES